MVNYFFDTYAIIEMLEQNPAYKKYNEYPLVTTILNKIELAWWALTRHDQKFADVLLKSLAHMPEISDEIIREAMLFRKQQKRRHFSYADAVDYVFAKKNSLRFLTGDKEFRDLPGVEFVPGR